MELLKRIEGDGMENLLIKGDNLDSLKWLKEEIYKGERDRIKLVITDPPYNLNGKYTYDDNRKGEWLYYMRERLELIRDVMDEDGVIFINISEKELFRLGVLMDDIFGINNRLPVFYWKKGGGINSTKSVKKVCEPILCYSKNISKFKGFSKVKNNTLNLKEKRVLRDAEGYFMWMSSLRSKMFYRRDRDYVLIDPDGNRHYPDGNNKYGWEQRQSLTDEEIIKSGGVRTHYYSEDDTIKYLKEGRLKWDRDLKGDWELYMKYRRNEYKTADDVINFEGCTNKSGYNEIKNILEGRNFSYSKPLKLIKYLIHLSGVEDGYILDAWAGSGSTACAVSQYNKEMGLNNNFIMMQIDEGGLCDEVTYTRIQRTIEGYVDNKGRDVEGVGGNVSYYKLDSFE